MSVYEKHVLRHDETLHGQIAALTAALTRCVEALGDPVVLRKRAEERDRAQNQLRYFYGHHEYKRDEILQSAIKIISDASDDDHNRAWAIDELLESPEVAALVTKGKTQ